MSSVIFLLILSLFQSLSYVESGSAVESLFEYYGAIGLRRNQLMPIRPKLSYNLYSEHQLSFSVPFIDCLQGLDLNNPPPNGAKESINQLTLKANEITAKVEPLRTTVEVGQQAKVFGKLFDEMLEIQKVINSTYSDSSCYKYPCCPFTEHEDRIQYHIRKAIEALDRVNYDPFK